MGINEAYIRQMRGMKDSADRRAFRSKGKMLPFINTAALQHGTYRMRLWPADDKKNPVGFLFYKSHNIPLSSDKDTLLCQCPRSNNWDPIPYAYEDPINNEGPLYKERCWSCELLQEVRNMGISGQLPEQLQQVLGQIYGDRNGEKIHFMATIRMSVVGRETVVSEATGKPYERITYGPDPSNDFHCDLDLTPGVVSEQLFEILELVPDIQNLAYGRWIQLTKAGDGSGVGGYRLNYEPNSSPAGFQIPEDLYQNYWKWGAGGPQKPSRRKSYLEVESTVISNQTDPTTGVVTPRAWWRDQMRQWGIPLSDAEVTGGAPF